MIWATASCTDCRNAALCDGSVSPLARARSTSPRASVVEIPNAAATSAVPNSWVSDMMSSASSAGSSSRRNRSISANLAANAGDCAPSDTARTRNGSPAVQFNNCSATGIGPSCTRGRSRSMAIVRTRNSTRCSCASAATTSVALGSAARSASRCNSVSVRNWASSTTSAASGGSSSRGGRASTVRPARRSASRAAARTVDFPLPIPPVTRTLAGTVAAFARARMASRAGGGTSVRGSVTVVPTVHRVRLSGRWAIPVAP